MLQPYRDLPLRGSSDIRTLVLQPSRNDEKPIECHLEVLHLDRFPEYEALSYTWGASFEGDALHDRSITLCGEHFTVTGNLYAALMRFRLQDAPRVLWVDAVCIDQSNVAERSAQVAIMSKIYAAASRVLIWLGEDSVSRDGHITLKVLGHLAAVVTDWDIVQAIMRARSKSDHSGHYQEAVMSSLLPPDLRSDSTLRPVWTSTMTSPWSSTHSPVTMVVQAIHIFFTRRYFRRLWVVQEMYHAKNGTIHCGSQSIYWQRFQRGFDRLRKACTSLLMQGTYKYDSLDVLQGTMVERVAALFQWSKSERFFLKCIEQCNGTHCQDDRDRIFALSSLNSADWPQPDYTLSVSQVFSDFSRSCVKHHHAHSLLFHAARQQADPLRSVLRREIQPDLPSWAIDWRHSGEIGTSFWTDWVSKDGPNLEARVDDQGRLFCSLGILAIAQVSEKSEGHDLTAPKHIADEAAASTFRSVWFTARARSGENIRPGDVLCRIPSSVEMAVDDTDGLTKSRQACRRPSRRLYEDGIVVLRPVELRSDEHIVVPLGERALFKHRELSTLPNDGAWKRFCII